MCVVNNSDFLRNRYAAPQRSGLLALPASRLGIISVMVTVDGNVLVLVITFKLS